MATWIGRVTVTGDATGGDFTIQLELWPESQPGAGHFFNLEQLMVTSDAAFSAAFAFILINFSHPIAGAFSNLQYTVQIGGNQILNAAINTHNMLPKPLFLGQPSLPDSRAALSLHGTNGDGDVYTMQAQGYVWEPRSVQAPGGLQRPVQAIYG